MRALFFLHGILATTTSATALPVQRKALSRSFRGANPSLLFAPVSNDITTFPRGGAAIGCGDPDGILLLKSGVSVAMETLGLLGVLFIGQQLATLPMFPTVVFQGLPVVQWASLVMIAFNASAIKNIVDGGITTASNQVLKPNVVPGDPTWYSKLKKPWFTPPGWLFPIMWVIVSKPTQIWAVSRLLKTATTTPWPALAVYCTHLSLGDTWNSVFFGCQRVEAGAVVIGTFWSALVASGLVFGALDKMAGMLLLPTIGWVTVASALNFEIYRLNKSER
jgi:benzodiazapine receptor